MRSVQIRHLRWIPVFLGVGLFACTAEVPGLGAPDGDPRAVLRGEFNSNVLPLMQTVCAGCHAGDREFIDFMAPHPNSLDQTTTDAYDRVIAWPGLVNTEDAGQSRIITKGQHEGRAWTPEELNVINPWLTNEASFGDTGTEVETTAVVPVTGFNEYDLGALGIPEGEGTKIRFVYEFSPPLVYLSTLTVLGDADGFTGNNPVVGVVVDGIPYWDPNNKFQGVVVDVGPDQEICIGGCSIIASWVPADILANAGSVALQFEFASVIATGTGGTGNGGGGCEQVDVFFNTVVPTVNNMTQPCLNCHGGGTVGIDMSNLGAADAAGRQTQCDQFFIRSNRSDPAGEHDWIRTVDPSVGLQHAGGNTSQATADAADTATDNWMTMELQ